MTVRRAVIGVVLVLAVASAAAAYGALVIVRRTAEPFRAYEGERLVDIASGSGARAIERRLVEEGVVRDWLTFRVALWQSGDARRLKAGEYLFDRPMSAREVIAKLVEGDVYERLITFPEGLTMREMADVFEKQAFGTASAFLEAARDASLVADLDPLAENLEGYLFPETYALARDASAATLVTMMVQRFREALPDSLRQAAAEQGRSVREIVTLASLVEKETALDGERPLVAGVYVNRLARGMALQCDPTVIYALQLAGRFEGNLTREDLGFDSPYNTYRYPGLPPGPIASPGRPSLAAAARPAKVEFLYFVSRNDGSHVFARTLAEHNRNVFQYQILYFREQRRLEAERRQSQ